MGQNDTFFFYDKIIRILRSCSMKILCTFPTVNISKLIFLLVICIAKNFIWTTLKMIFSIFRFFCTLRFQIYKYCPNHTSMEILFIQLSDYTYISIVKNCPLWLILCFKVTFTRFYTKNCICYLSVWQYFLIYQDKAIVCLPLAVD